jgi:hypothetical protein
MNEEKELAIYQTEEGAIEIRADFNAETVWATQKEIAQIFSVTPQNITLHLKSIFESRELEKDRTCKDSLQVQKEGSREVKRTVKEYNLDVLISVAYRIDSVVGTSFRKWATKTLKKHITEGYTINKSILKKKEDLYKKVLNDIQKLSQDTIHINQNDILELVKNFSHTWFSLESFDENKLPQKGQTRSEVTTTAKDLHRDVGVLKKELVKKGEATDLFAQEKIPESLEGIFGNVMQTFDGKDLYGSLEEKAAHLLYFIVKNHAFNDGNKRTGAFSFIWFLKNNKVINYERITPETLTTLTLLIAQSDPDDKDRIIGLILLMFR